MTQAGFAKLPDAFRHIGYDSLRSVFKAMLAAAPTPPAQDEPVGFINRVELFGVHVSADLNNLGESLPDETPLYTRPQSGKLRQAAEELIEHWDSDNDQGEISAWYVKNLRAALEGK
jgi:hypothetical protein